jgi:hypothetical protein
LETGLPRAFVAPELAIMPFPFWDTEGNKAAYRHIPFQIRTRPCAIPKSCAAGGQKRHEAGGDGAVGRAERSDGDEHFRQVLGCRQCGWRAMPSVSMRERTGVRWRPRHAAGPYGPPITPLACVGVKPGATVTKEHIDEPDLMGSRGGLGTLVGIWQTFLSRCRGMGQFD